MKKMALAVSIALLGYDMFPSQAGASANLLNASLNQETHTVIVAGSVEETRAGEVLLTVTDPNGKLEYINQKKTDGDGKFSFSYRTLNRTKGTYSVRVQAAGSLDKPVVLNATFGYTGGAAPASGSGPLPSSGKGQQAPSIVQLPNGHVSIRMEGQIAPGTRRAVLSLSDETVRKAIAEAKPDPRGVRTIAVQLAERIDAEAFALRIPEELVASNREEVHFKLDTPLGTLTIPSNLLIPSGKEGNLASIAIRSVGHAALNGDPGARIGTRPAIGLEIEVDGRAVGRSNPLSALRAEIPYEPNVSEAENTELITVLRMNAAGGAEPVPNGRYRAETGSVAFRTKEFGVFALDYSSYRFKDIGSFGWARSPIEALASRGIVKGVSATSYSPSAPVTREDFILMLVRAMEEKVAFQFNFSDAVPGSPAYEALGTARELGIANGVGGNRFAPKANVTRQDVMVYLAKALQLQGQGHGNQAPYDLDGRFKDSGELADYAKNSAAMLVRLGIVQGNGQKLDPRGVLTRAEAAVLVYRFLILQ